MQVLNADVQMEKNMSKQHIVVDTIIDLLERNKDVINAQLEGADESVSVQLDVKTNASLPAVNGAGSSGVSSLPQSWYLGVVLNKDKSYQIKITPIA